MKKIITAVVIVAVIIIGSNYLLKNNKVSGPTSQNSSDLKETQSSQNQTATNPADSSQLQNQNSEEEISVSAQVPTPVNHEVIYTNSGYSPLELIIKVGDTVTFKNESSNGMWTASGMHPSHVVYSGTSLQSHCPDTSNTSFDECQSSKSGESWSFKFDKKGR